MNFLFQFLETEIFFDFFFKFKLDYGPQSLWELVEL